ncbi:hypothetical protein L484_004430 [Morus notabilis]|uniref:Uncharacterized protein n=1 Tax=Morus notabilis TaxID=981085 RepID=W9RUY4_9ROSA|nr:hypothetical protein L484_004430 [Morus notabilis]
MGNAMAGVIDSIWEILCKACNWVLSKIEWCLNYISEKTNNLVNRAKRFYDNLTESLKESIAKAKRAIDEKLENAADLVRSIKKKSIISSCSDVEAAKKLVVQIKNLVVSMLKLILDLNKSESGKSFLTLMDEVSLKTGKKKLGVGEFKEDMMDTCGVMSRVGYLVRGFLPLIIVVTEKPDKILCVIVEVCKLFFKEPNRNKSIKEMKNMESTSFKLLESDEERKAAASIYIALLSFASNFGF